MAASEAEKYASSDTAIADYKVILCAYADSLESSIKKRYIEKISVIGMDPLLSRCRNKLRNAFLL